MRYKVVLKLATGTLLVTTTQATGIIAAYRQAERMKRETAERLEQQVELARVEVVK